MDEAGASSCREGKMQGASEMDSELALTGAGHLRWSGARYILCPAAIHMIEKEKDLLNHVLVSLEQ